MKYTMLKNKNTGVRSIRNNEDGSLIIETENPKEYARLRKLAEKNLRAASKNDLMQSMGLSRVKGSVSGRTYWE